MKMSFLKLDARLFRNCEAPLVKRKIPCGPFSRFFLFSMKKHFLALVLLGLAALSHAQTNRQNVLSTSGSTNTIWTMRQTSAHTWIAAGNNGVLLRHHDSSKNWLPITSPSTSDFRSISFPDSLTGFICGTANGLIKTTNGGTTWTNVSTGMPSVSLTSILALHFLTPTTGFIGGSMSGGVRYIRRTTDGGATWTVVTPAGMNSTPYAIGFFDANTGISAGVSGTIYRTTDAGLTWTAVSSGVTNSLYSLSVADATTAIICGTGGTILRTTDAGATWSSVSSGTTLQLNGVQFSDAQNGMIAGHGGNLLRTTNGGATWNALPTATTKNLYAVSPSSSAHALVVGASGMALRVDTLQPFHRLFDEDFKHPTDTTTYFGYTNTDLSGSTFRKWSFTNRNEANNGLQMASWFPGKFAIYDASYYEDSLGYHSIDSAYLETRTLDLSGTTQLSLRWNEAFYTHPDGRSRTWVQGYNGSTWVDLYTSNGMEFGDSVYSAVFPDYKRSIDISVLAGATNAKLRFGYTAGNTQDGLKQFWAVGDLEITTQSTALQVTGVDLFPGPDGNCRYTGSQKLRVQVSNTGDLPVFPLEFGWLAGARQGVNADYGQLAAGSSAWYMIADSIQVPSGGSVNLKAWLRKMPNLQLANDTLAMTIQSNPIAPQSLGTDTVLCNGQSLTLTAPVFTTHLQWSTGDTSRTITVAQAGTYWFSGLWQSCAVGDTIVINTGISIPQIQLNGNTLNATAPSATSYQWYLNGALIPGAVLSYLLPQTSGSYTVVVTGAGGCTATSTPVAFTPMGVSNASNISEPQLYPNPAFDILYLTQLADYQELTVLHSNGQRIYDRSLNGRKDISLSVRELPVGTYLIRLRKTNGESKTLRFSKVN